MEVPARKTHRKLRWLYVVEILVWAADRVEPKVPLPATTRNMVGKDRAPLSAHYQVCTGAGGEHTGHQSLVVVGGRADIGRDWFSR